MSDAAMAEKLWDLANLLTGFAVAQSIATTFGLAKREMKAIAGASAHKWAAIGTIGFTVFYVIAIIACGIAGDRLDQGPDTIWLWVMLGRVFAVVLFAVVLLITLLGSRKDEIKKEQALAASWETDRRNEEF